MRPRWVPHGEQPHGARGSISRRQVGVQPVAPRVALQGSAGKVQTFWAGRAESESHPAPAGGNDAKKLQPKPGRVNSAAPAGAKPGTL